MRDIEGTQLLREMAAGDYDETIVQTETVKVTYSELRKLVRDVLQEEVQIASEEMDAPDELVVQEEPLYPGDDGLGQQPAPSGECGCEGGDEYALPAELHTGDDLAVVDDSMMGDESGVDELEAVLAMMQGPSDGELDAAEAHHDARAEGDFPPRRSLYEFFGPFKKGNQYAAVKFTLFLSSNTLSRRDNNGRASEALDSVLQKVSAENILSRSLQSALNVGKSGYHVQLGRAKVTTHTFNIPGQFDIHLDTMSKGDSEKSGEVAKKQIIDQLNAARNDIIDDLRYEVVSATDWKDANFDISDFQIEIVFK